jgi:hypothetical protein
MAPGEAGRHDLGFLGIGGHPSDELTPIAKAAIADRAAQPRAQPGPQQTYGEFFNTLRAKLGF